MSIKSQEHSAEIEKQNRIEQQQVDGLPIDRYSIVFILVILSLVAFLIVAKKIDLKYASIPLVISTTAVVIITNSSARIRKNEYKGVIHYKGEKNCGLSKIPIKNIDGVVVKDKVFKAPNGTDIKIDLQGNVSYVGFGSKFISCLNGGGYLTEAPDECWK